MTVGRMHRILSMVAAVSLFAGLRSVWINTTANGPGFGLVVTLCYFALGSLVIAALCVRGRGALGRIDVAVLAVAVVIEVVSLHRFVVPGFAYTGDEGALSALGLHALQHGHDPYQYAWPHAVAAFPTQLMGGGTVDRYPYPPFGIVLGAAAGVAGTTWGPRR